MWCIAKLPTTEGFVVHELCYLVPILNRNIASDISNIYIQENTIKHKHTQSQRDGDKEKTEKWIGVGCASLSLT